MVLSLFRPGSCCRAVLPAALLLASMAAPAKAQLDTAVSVTQAQPDEVLYGGFGLDLTLSDASGLNAVGQNYRNELSLYLEPRWAIGKRFLRGSGVWSKLVLSGRFVLSRAVAGTSDEFFSSTSNATPIAPCSDITPGQGGVIDPSQVRRCDPPANDRRTDYSDVSITASLPRWTTLPGALALSSSLRATLPLSAQSRYQTLRFGTTATSGVSRGFFGDVLRLGYNLGFTKNFHEYSTPGVTSSGLGPAAEIGGNTYGAVAGVGLSNLYADPARVGTGGFNTSFSFSNSLSAHVTIDKRWSLDVLYMWLDGFSYSHRCMADAGGQAVDTCTSGAAVAANSDSDVVGRGHRRSQVFWVTGTLGVNEWLSLSAAWTTWSPRQKPDSSYRQGFVSTDYNAFTSVLLSTTVSIEELAGRLSPRMKERRTP